MASVGIYNADGLNGVPPGAAPVILQELLNGSITSPGRGVLSLPSAMSPAAIKKALSSVIVLQSMPSTPKLKRKKIVMTYRQTTACKYFTKWRVVKNTVSHLNLPQTMGKTLSWFQGKNTFGQVYRLV